MTLRDLLCSVVYLLEARINYEQTTFQQVRHANIASNLRPVLQTPTTMDIIMVTMEYLGSFVTKQSVMGS
jgi:hypothetical protein